MVVTRDPVLRRQQQDGACTIPHFSKDGTALSAAERTATAERRGLCGSCGVKTHKMMFPLRKVALTNDNVYNGHCIRCYYSHTPANINTAINRGTNEEDKVPWEVYMAWQQQNPHLAIHHRNASSLGGKLSRSSVTYSSSTNHTNCNTEAAGRTRNGSASPRSSVSRHKRELSYPLVMLDHSDTSVTSRTSATRALNSSTTSMPVCGSSTTANSTSKTHRRYHSLGTTTNAATTNNNLPHRKSNTAVPATSYAPTTRAEPNHRSTRHSRVHSNGSTSDCNSITTRSVEFSNQAVMSSPQEELSLSRSEHSMLQNTHDSHPEASSNQIFDMSVTSIGMSSVTELAPEELPEAQEQLLLEEKDATCSATECQTVVAKGGCGSVGPGTWVVTLAPDCIHQWLHDDQFHDKLDNDDPQIQIGMEHQDTIIEATVTAMKVSKCNSNVQRNGCFVLHFLSAANANQTTSLTHHREDNIIETLVSTMKCNLDDSNVAKNASMTLYHMLQHEQSNICSGDTMKTAVVDVLISCLERGGDSQGEETTQAICMALYQVLSCDKSNVTLGVIEAKRAKLMAALHLIMRHHALDQDLQQYTCGIAKVILANETIAADLHIEKHLIDSICLTADRYRDNPRVLREAFGGLFFATFSCNDIGTAVIASVLDGMELHQHISIQKYACGILRNLSVRPDHVNAIVESNGIQTIVQAMTDHLSDAELQCLACRALKHLAINEQNELGIQQHGGIGAIFEAIQRYSSDAKLQSEAYGALSNLSLRQDSRAILLGHKSLPACLQSAMKKYPRDANVQQKLTSVVLNLSVSSSFARSFDKLGGIALIVAAITNHSDDIKIQQNGVGSLRNLGKAGMCHSDSFASSRAFHAIVNSMKTFSSNLKMQIYAIGCLKNAASQKENSILVYQAAGIPAILSAMRKHPYDAGVQQEGCFALMHLSRVKDIGVGIALNGGTSCSIAAMQQYADSSALQNAACGLLWNLSTTKSSQKLISAEKGVEAIIKAMMNHTGAVDVNQKACLTLCNLASHDDCCWAIEHGCGIEAALAAMRNNASDLHLQKYACKFLATMLRREGTVDVIATNGGLPVVKAALEAHGDNADLKKYATKILEKTQRKLR